ncbi:hypothetical protein P7K49_007473, partial [Saguinus oedipus]
WEGKNENEVGRCKETGKVHVTVDLKYYRPTEVVRTLATQWVATFGWLAGKICS